MKKIDVMNDTGMKQTALVELAELPRMLALNDNDRKHLDSFRSGSAASGRKWTKSFNRSATLLPQIGKLIGARYGGPCDDDDAEVYFDAALPYLIDLAGANGRILGLATEDSSELGLCEKGERLYRGFRQFTPRTIEWLRWCTPNLVPINGDEVRSIVPDALVWVHKRERKVLDQWREHHESRFAHEPFGPSGKELGRTLRMTAAEMRAGDIRFVTPIDRTADELRAERRVRDASYQRAKRDAANAKAQSSSVEALKLWEVIDLKRRKFYKLKAAGELPALPAIPRGADPAPYLAAFAAVYRSTRGTSSAAVALAA
ncbi:hypothetical protein [Methylobacterium nigriterrae]|uniref:hypothetical protein n=1 Tax=Methylobacterium nigriterrae TaxID=3127512 RepID=UPI00301387D5